MENRLWYAEATLMLGENRLRAGTLVQCVRRWENLSPEDKSRAAIKLVSLKDVTFMQDAEIAALACDPGYRFA